MKSRLLIFFLFLSIFNVYASDVKFYNINAMYGISMREMASVCKDENGFIWASSKTGILRITESDYRIYQTKVSIPEKEIYYENNIAYAAELQTRTTPLSVLYVEYVRKSALLLKSYIQNNTNSIQTVTITIYVYDQDDNYKKTSYERTMQFPASGILTVTCNIPDVETGEYLVLSASNDEGIIMDGHTRIKII